MRRPHSYGPRGSTIFWEPGRAGPSRGARVANCGEAIMTDISDISAVPRRFSLSARIAALAVLAGLSYGAAATAPAAAASSDWRTACPFKSIPGGAAASIQYDICVHLQSCQNLANAAGREIFELGCFGVEPEGVVQPAARR